MQSKWKSEESRIEGKQKCIVSRKVRKVTPHIETGMVVEVAETEMLSNAASKLRHRLSMVHCMM